MGPWRVLVSRAVVPSDSVDVRQRKRDLLKLSLGIILLIPVMLPSIIMRMGVLHGHSSNLLIFLVSGTFVFVYILGFRSLPLILAEITLLLFTFGCLLADLVQAANMQDRSWTFIILWLDFAVLWGCRPWLHRSMIIPVYICFVMIAVERNQRFGIFDVSVLRAPDGHWDELTGCAEPPCARSLLYCVGSLLRAGFVFAYNSHTLLGFAQTQRRSVGLTQVVAQSLARYDLAEAMEAIESPEAEELPQDLLQAYADLIANLHAYRPFLPHALIDKVDPCRPVFGDEGDDEYGDGYDEDIMEGRGFSSELTPPQDDLGVTMKLSSDPSGTMTHGIPHALSKTFFSGKATSHLGASQMAQSMPLSMQPVRSGHNTTLSKMDNQSIQPNPSSVFDQSRRMSRSRCRSQMSAESPRLAPRSPALLSPQPLAGRSPARGPRRTPEPDRRKSSPQSLKGKSMATVGWFGPRKKRESTSRGSSTPRRDHDSGPRHGAGPSGGVGGGLKFLDVGVRPCRCTTLVTECLAAHKELYAACSRLFTAHLSAVLSGGGVLIITAGSRMLSTWNTHRPAPRHALHAGRTALAFCAACSSHHSRWAAGLALGEVAAGLFGDDRQRVPCALGGPARGATRLTALALSICPGAALCSAPVHDAAGQLPSRPVDVIAPDACFPPAAVPQPVYELLGQTVLASGAWGGDAAAAWHRAFAALMAGGDAGLADAGEGFAAAAAAPGAPAAGHAPRLAAGVAPGGYLSSGSGRRWVGWDGAMGGETEISVAGRPPAAGATGGRLQSKLGGRGLSVQVPGTGEGKTSPNHLAAPGPLSPQGPASPLIGLRQDIERAMARGRDPSSSLARSHSRDNSFNKRSRTGAGTSESVPPMEGRTATEAQPAATTTGSSVGQSRSGHPAWSAAAGEKRPSIPPPTTVSRRSKTSGPGSPKTSPRAPANPDNRTHAQVSMHFAGVPFSGSPLPEPTKESRVSVHSRISDAGRQSPRKRSRVSVWSSTSNPSRPPPAAPGHAWVPAELATVPKELDTMDITTCPSQTVPPAHMTTQPVATESSPTEGRSQSQVENLSGTIPSQGDKWQGDKALTSVENFVASNSSQQQQGGAGRGAGRGSGRAAGGTTGSVGPATPPRSSPPRTPPKRAAADEQPQPAKPVARAVESCCSYDSSDDSAPAAPSPNTQKVDTQPGTSGMLSLRMSPRNQGAARGNNARSGSPAPAGGASPGPGFGPAPGAPASDEPAASFEDSDGCTWLRSGRLLGRGAAGSVWLGLGDGGELAALKSLPLPKARSEGSFRLVEELLCEVELLSELRHENIVCYLASAVAGEHVFIAMEFVPGGCLQSAVEQFGALPERTARRYVRDVCRGLGFLHHNGVVHRDLKPANALLQIDGQVKIADFGGSVRLTTGWTGGTESINPDGEAHSMMGTPAYMAPEACRGDAVTAASDIWAMGICCHVLLSGALPYPDNIFKVEGVFGFVLQMGYGNVRPKFASAVEEGTTAATFLTVCLLPTADERPTAERLLCDSFLLQ